jgi:hypothetical protein
MRLKLFAIMTSALALAACASGPDYAAPATPSAAAGKFVAANSDAVQPLAPVPADWWRLYDDPVLDGLIADALKANTDVRAAVARLARARAALSEIKVDRLPQVDANASVTRGRETGSTDAQTSFDGRLDVAYELDLFGRVSRNVEAARGDVGAAEGDADAVRVAIVAETARAYADAASSAERLAVATRIVELLDQSQQITERRVEIGETTRLDTARIAALKNQRQAEIPAIAAERDSALFRLAMLTGRGGGGGGGRGCADLPNGTTHPRPSAELASLDLSHQKQDEKDDEDQPHHAGRPIAPARAVRPGGKRADQNQDENDDEDCRQHVASPWSGEGQGAQPTHLPRFADVILAQAALRALERGLAMRGFAVTRNELGGDSGVNQQSAAAALRANAARSHSRGKLTFELHIADPGVDLPLGLVLGDAVTLLDLTNQFDAAAFHDVEVVVSELAPLLLHLAAELLPIAFDTIPVHGTLTPLVRTSRFGRPSLFTELLCGDAA